MRNTTLCYLERQGSYLLLHRIKKEKDINKDKWIGIGGKFEEGESPEDCLLREAWEETGLTLNSWKYHAIITFVTIDDGVPYSEYMHLFSSRDFSGELKTCDEGVLEWVPKEEMGKLNLWEGDLVFLRLMEAGVPFFSMKLVYRDRVLEQVVLNGAPLTRRGFGQWN